MSKDLNANEFLKKQHREVESMFKHCDPDAEPGEKASLALKICNALTVHAMLEEELYYPAARSALDEDDRDMVAEAKVEHGSLKKLIADIGNCEPGDEAFDANLVVLKEYTEHHVHEEEHELMPAVKKTDLDLDSLGQRLEQRNAQLQEEVQQHSGQMPAPGSTRKSTSTAKHTSHARKASPSRRKSAH